jgi:2-polyprenyl-3-methyl-5-hydroxy-6-metoxy-1,4-benzoquinol methylase
MSAAPFPLPFPQRACPICESRSSRLLYPQRFHALQGATLLTGFDLVSCERCGCGFADRIPDQADFDAYYRDLSKYEYGSRGGLESEHDLARFAAMADIIQRHLPSAEARILDVGCATGGFLSILKQRGYAHVLGLDPSPACSEAANRLYGIRVLTGTLGVFPPGEKRFDFLILVGVVEHVRDLAGLLTCVSQWIKPAGMVYIEIPDASNFQASRNAPFQEFSIEHINYFGTRSLRNLMSRNGFTELYVEQCVREANHGTMAPVVGAVYQHSVTEISELVGDDATEPALRAYIASSRAAEDHERQIIARLVEERKPLIVWGVGTHTLRLLATSRLPEANIVTFVDSNTKIQGKLINDVPIIAPSALAGRSEAILIGSWLYQIEIVHQIRNDLKLENEILKLYEI